MDKLEEAHNFIFRDTTAFKGDAISEYCFFRKYALENPLDFPKFKKIICHSLNKVETSPTARKLLSKVFGNLSDEASSRL